MCACVRVFEPFQPTLTEGVPTDRWLVLVSWFDLCPTGVCESARALSIPADQWKHLMERHRRHFGKRERGILSPSKVFFCHTPPFPQKPSNDCDIYQANKTALLHAHNTPTRQEQSRKGVSSNKKRLEIAASEKAPKRHESERCGGKA